MIRSDPLLCAVFGVLALLAPAAAQAPQQPPATTVTGPAMGWVKVCNTSGANRTGCVISNEMVSEGGNPLASVGIQEIVGDRRRRIVTVTPLGMWIESGVQFRVDNNPPTAAAYGTCLVNGCFASIELTDALLQQMKRGQRLSLAVRQANQAILNIEMSLQNFGTVYDGGPMEEATLAERGRAFQDEIRRRQQGQQPPSGAPPAAPQQAPRP